MREPLNESSPSHWSPTNDSMRPTNDQWTGEGDWGQYWLGVGGTCADRTPDVGYWCSPHAPRGTVPLNCRTAARTLLLRPYLAHFCSFFRRVVAALSVLTPGFQKVVPKDRGPAVQRSETAGERVVADRFLVDRYRACHSPWRDRRGVCPRAEVQRPVRGDRPRMDAVSLVHV